MAWCVWRRITSSSSSTRKRRRRKKRRKKRTPRTSSHSSLGRARRQKMEVACSWLVCWFRCFPRCVVSLSFVGRPELPGIMVGIDVQDSFMFCAGCDAPLAVFPLVVARLEMLGIMAGMNQKDRHVARLLFTRPFVVCNNRCRWLRGAKKLRIFRSCSSFSWSSTSLFMTQRLIFMVPGCLVDHRDSPVAL